MDSKSLKLIGIAVNVACFVLGFAGNIISAKQQQQAIDEAVLKAVKKQL